MDGQSTRLDFAVIGHQENWQQITGFVNFLRKSSLESLSTEKLKDIFPFIPPRDLFRIKINSANGRELNGVYIETFISPDALDAKHLQSNISKVKEAAAVASKLGAKIGVLGGFTSIVIEGDTGLITQNGTCFTTGNTLAAAFIVKGIEKASDELKISLPESSLLVIGATGDIGQAVSKYFSSRVKHLLLCARNENRLKNFAMELTQENTRTKFSCSLEDLIPEADIIISVASTAGIPVHRLKKGVLICDAGYPKNLDLKIRTDDVRIFHGGMGVAPAGFQFDPDYSGKFYQFPSRHTAHGCLLEAIVLCFENRIESFSKGKGKISTEAMEVIYKKALQHGIDIAPFYNSKGLW